MKQIHSFLLAILFGLSASVAASSGPLSVPTTTKTEIVMFEDNILYDTPAEGSLIYRVEGDKQGVSRKNGKLKLGERGVSYIHPAQYDRAALKLKLAISSGEPAVAVCHNGMKDVAGIPNPNPGFQVVFGNNRTVVVDLRTGKALATINRTVPRGRAVNVSLAWDIVDHSLRMEWSGRTFHVKLPAKVYCRGGFAIRLPARPKTGCKVYRIQAIWEDTRDHVLYDGTDTVYDGDGHEIGRIPSITLPDNYKSYATAAVDLRRERSLIVFGGPDLNSDHPDTLKGWAVRDLRTGRLLHVFGPRVNGCLPQQGGGSMDGYWLLQSWNVPASLCWLDWNAFDRGDIAGFVVPYKQAVKDGDKLVGFHDPANALDGSIARYLRITENWRGVNHLTVHPNLKAYAPFDDVAMPPPSHPQVSHTGPAGLPTQLVVRDRDRAWYEEWAYLGNNLHYECRGYNLFARKDDWGGPTFPVEKDAEPYSDYANMTPDLIHPGRLTAPFIRFSAKETGAKRVQPLAIHRLKVGADHFIVEKAMPFAQPWPVPFEMLMDRKRLLPPRKREK